MVWQLIDWCDNNGVEGFNNGGVMIHEVKGSGAEDVDGGVSERDRECLVVFEEGILVCWARFVVDWPGSSDELLSLCGRLDRVDDFVAGSGFSMGFFGCGDSAWRRVIRLGLIYLIELGKFYGTPKYLSVPVHQIVKLIIKLVVFFFKKKRIIFYHWQL